MFIAIDGFSMTLVPPDFTVPTHLETATWRLHPITIHDVVRDYEAVMTSQPELWQQFGDLWGWPSPDLSFEQDLIDLAWHQKEAQKRRSFTYAMVSPSGTRQLGCVYIEPPIQSGCDASVLYWVRTSELASGLNTHLDHYLRDWLQSAWPFDRVEFKPNFEFSNPGDP